MSVIIKIKKVVKGLSILIKNPWLLNILLKEDEQWWKKLEKDYQVQQPLPTISFQTLFPNFRETINCFSFLGGGSLPTDIALLMGLSKRFEKCKYFEIGTWRGESVYNVAGLAEECHTLNLSKEQILELGLSSKYADLHGLFSKKNPKINHHFGDSRYFDYEKLNQSFDLIFIDGDHTFDFVKNDTQKVFDHLIHEKSIVVWHDYAYNPEKSRPEVFAGILAGLPKDLPGNLYHVANTMCAIYLPEKLPSQQLVLPVKPTHVFQVEIKQREVDEL